MKSYTSRYQVSTARYKINKHNYERHTSLSVAPEQYYTINILTVPKYFTISDVNN